MENKTLTKIKYDDGQIWVDTNDLSYKDLRKGDPCYDLQCQRIEEYTPSSRGDGVQWKIYGQSINLSLPNIPYVEIEDVLDFKHIPHEVIKEIAVLAFHSKEWISSDVKVTYYPYIKEHYEDAMEYFQATFTGLFAGNNTAEYVVRLYTTFDVSIHYSYKGDSSRLLHVSNQNRIQELLQPFKAASAKKYTEEDLRKAINLSRLTSSELREKHGFWKDEYTPDEIIQSLQPKVVSIEIETRQYWFQDGISRPVMEDGIPKDYKGDWIITPVTYQKDGKTFIKIKNINI